MKLINYFHREGYYMDAKWLEQVKAKLEAKMAYGREQAKDLDFIPYTVKDGKWAPGNSRSS